MTKAAYRGKFVWVLEGVCDDGGGMAAGCSMLPGAEAEGSAHCELQAQSRESNYDRERP